MYILGIETTGAYASVGLLMGGDMPMGPADVTGPANGTETTARIDVVHGNDRFSHLQNLTPQIKAVLERNDLKVGDLDAIAVSKGPGSFTGIRIGVSTARALSQVSGVPCVGVSSLEALAMRATDAGDTLICPILDARRKQVYGGGYRLSTTPEELVPAGSYLIGEFLEQLEKCDRIGSDTRIFFLGDGIDTCSQEIEVWAEEKGRNVAFAAEDARYQDAGTVVLRGAQLFDAGETCEYMKLEPDYMRMAEAERKLKLRQAEEAKAKAEEAKAKAQDVEAGR